MRRPSQNKGGRLKGGRSSKGSNLARTISLSLPEDTRDGITNLAEALGWSKSYLATQILNAYLGLPSELGK